MALRAAANAKPPPDQALRLPPNRSVIPFLWRALLLGAGGQRGSAQLGAQPFGVTRWAIDETPIRGGE
jgi:hypothetical protein